jgi:amidophosphoribosyltransferase
MVDDSIVRGTTSRKIVAMLREAGATEVHMLVSSPPIHHSCYYGIDTSERSELIAVKHPVKEICGQIHADSLHYLSIEGMLNAIGLPPDGFCGACFTGKYPIDIENLNGKFSLEGGDKCGC